MAFDMKQASDFIGEAMASGFARGWYVDLRYEKDDFRRTSGSNPTIEHIPADGDRGKFMGAYSIVTLSTGFVGIEYMPAEDIEKAKKQSKRNGPGSPWSTWFGEMAKKCVVKRHAKRFLPSGEQFDKFRRMVEDDNEEYREGAPQQAPGNSEKYISGHRRVELWNATKAKFGDDEEAAAVGLRALFEENSVEDKTKITPVQFTAMMKTLTE
jgi:recombinational DNA repair protein RecT